MLKVIIIAFDNMLQGDWDMQQPKILDNKQQGRVIDELRQGIKSGAKMSVISAYFTIYAYEALKKELADIDELRFIFTTPSYIKQKSDFQREFYIAHREFGNRLSGNEFELKLRNKLTQSAIAKDCAQWLRKKVSIKSYRENNPAQMRLAYVENVDPEQDIAIQGTVDFSSDGLGITPSARNDMNTCIYSRPMGQAVLQIFDGIWNNPAMVEDVTEKVLSEMEVLYKENTPEAIYFITLYHIFEAYLGELTEETIIKTKTGIKESLIWNKLYKFQRDGVMGAIDKIEKYGGCIIADSVGLGKTFTALAIIKYYELRNDRVLVLAPKKLRENWTIYTQNDKRNIFAADRFNYDVLNHTDLSRYKGFSGSINLSTLNWGNYDLIVIDESHNFRNNVPHKDRKTRYERLMDDIIKAGVKTKVLMLSATPVNNRMNDIKNQIAFITEGKNDALKSTGIPNIETTLRKAQLIFNRWSQLPERQRTTKAFVEMMDLEYFKLLDTLTIARSRKHIEKYYNTAEIGKFPTRLKPINECPEIDTLGEFPPIGEVNKMINRLTLGLYAPLRYVRPEKRHAYENRYDMTVADGRSVFRQADRENQLIQLMRVNLLKRMESSIHSFVLTVEKISQRIEHTLAIIEKHEGEYHADLNIEELDFDEDGLDMGDLVFGSKVKVLLQDMDLIKWRQDLQLDLEELQEILQSAKVITPIRDNKLQTLKNRIADKIQNPINAGNGKLIIFTAFADTAEYLYENIAPQLEALGIYTALVTGGTGTNKSTIPIPSALKRSIKLSDLNTVLTLFSPISKSCKSIFPDMQEEIDILIATDCISEGQNLQDCDYLTVVYNFKRLPLNEKPAISRHLEYGSYFQQFAPTIHLCEKYILANLLSNSRTHLLCTLSPQMLEARHDVRQNPHGRMGDVDKIHQMLNAIPAAETVLLERPEHLLFVVVDLDVPTESVKAQRIEHHVFRTCLAESSAFLPRTAHAQVTGANGAKKKATRPLLRLRDIGIDEAFPEEVRQDAAAADKVVAHAVTAVEILYGNFRAMLPRPPALSRRGGATFVHRRIGTDVGDDGKILVAAHPLQKRFLCVPAVE